MCKYILLLLSALLLGLSTANAQTPQLINYQTVLRDSNGALMSNSSITMRISILEGSAVATPAVQSIL